MVVGDREALSFNMAPLAFPIRRSLFAIREEMQMIHAYRGLHLRSHR